MMGDRPLRGKRVAVLVETEFIASEIQAYQTFFSRQGATVDLMTYLWGAPRRTLVADVTEPGQIPPTLEVDREIAGCKPDDYAIVLVAANYVACRLREIPPMGSLGSVAKLPTPPAVQFMAAAMRNKKIVKGALCHGLWLLTPMPPLLKGRKIICHTVVLADIHNAGAEFIPAPSHVVVDHDLVTARSAADLDAYCTALLETYQALTAP